MDAPGVIQLLFLITLIFLSAFFSSAETALSTVNRVRMRTLEDEGDKRAARVNKILEKYSKMLSAILIGNNVVNLSASALATTLAMRISFPVGIATGILTIVVLLCGEILPKTWAMHSSEKLSLAYSGIIYVLMQILTPVIFLVDKIANAILHLLHVDPNKKVSMTEADLRTYVEVGHEDGVIESEEREMIYNVFDFSDALAKDIMIPRINMVTVDVADTYEEVLSVFRESMYTRLPVYQDDKDNIIGVINIKDFMNGTDFFCYSCRCLQITRRMQPCLKGYCINLCSIFCRCIHDKLQQQTAVHTAGECQTEILFCNLVKLGKQCFFLILHICFLFCPVLFLFL